MIRYKLVHVVVKKSNEILLIILDGARKEAALMISQLRLGLLVLQRRKEGVLIMLVNRFDTSLIIPYLINLGWRMLN